MNLLSISLLETQTRLQILQLGSKEHSQRTSHIILDAMTLRNCSRSTIIILSATLIRWARMRALTAIPRPKPRAENSMKEMNSQPRGASPWPSKRQQGRKRPRVRRNHWASTFQTTWPIWLTKQFKIRRVTQSTKRNWDLRASLTNWLQQPFWKHRGWRKWRNSDSKWASTKILILILIRTQNKHRKVINR